MSFTTLGQDLLFALGLGGEYEEEESWNSRLKKAAFTASQVHGDGLRLEFMYENVSQINRRNTSVHNFSGLNGTYIQEHGRVGARYPMRIILWGKDCDKVAKGFEALLLLSGVGMHEHPMYGEKQVIPVGDIVRRDDLKTRPNQVILETEFFETTGLAYPESQIDPASDVAAALAALNDALAAQLAMQADLNSPLLGLGFLDSLQNVMSNIAGALDVLADATQSFEQGFDDLTTQINSTSSAFTSTLTLGPETVNGLASSSITFVQLGAESVSPPSEILAAYGDMTTGLFAAPIAESDPSGLGPGNNAEQANNFHTNEMTAGAAMGGQAKAIISGEFTTRREALDATSFILAQLDAYSEWADDNYDSLSAGGPSLGGVDLGSGRQELTNLVSLTADYLIGLSFNLKQERAIVLDRARTPIDVCAELYPGPVDDNLNFFIQSTNLVGKEIIEIPKGRVINYYV